MHPIFLVLTANMIVQIVYQVNIKLNVVILALHICTSVHIEHMKPLIDNDNILAEQTAVLIHGVLHNKFLTKDALNLARENNAA